MGKLNNKFYVLQKNDLGKSHIYRNLKYDRINFF
jgi:hypothetical protein